MKISSSTETKRLSRMILVAVCVCIQRVHSYAYWDVSHLRFSPVSPKT